MSSSVLISSIEGNRQKLDGGAMFGNVPRPMWSKWYQPDELGRIELACRSMLVEWNGLKILFEAGIGGFFEPKLRDRFGVSGQGHELLSNLASAGINPDQIDWVVLSHLHFDHAGGLLSAYDASDPEGGSLVFSKAKFLVGEGAWERACKPHFRDRASFVPKLNKLLEESGRLCIVKDKRVPDELAPILSVFETNGHTPAQLHSVVQGDEFQVVFAGDLIPGCPWVHVPITMGYDRYPEMLIDEKIALYERMDFNKAKLFFCHDPNYVMTGLTRDPQNSKVGCIGQIKALAREKI